MKAQHDAQGNNASESAKATSEQGAHSGSGAGSIVDSTTASSAYTYDTEGNLLDASGNIIHQAAIKDNPDTSQSNIA